MKSILALNVLSERGDERGKVRERGKKLRNRKARKTWKTGIEMEGKEGQRR